MELGHFAAVFGRRYDRVHLANGTVLVLAQATHKPLVTLVCQLERVRMTFQIEVLDGHALVREYFILGAVFLPGDYQHLFEVVHGRPVHAAHAINIANLAVETHQLLREIIAVLHGYLTPGHGGN